MAALGDEGLFATLEADGDAIARGEPRRCESGALAEVVERPAWAKIEVVTADEQENGAAGGRITLNLGHTLAHALEAVDGYATLLHGEAVAYGLRAAVRVGRARRRHAAGPGRADRAAPRRARPRPRRRSPTRPTAVLEATATDKKHAAGRLRWVLPTADGVVVRRRRARVGSSRRRSRSRSRGVLGGAGAPA